VSEPRIFPLDDQEAALVARVLPPARAEPARLEAIFRRLTAAPVATGPARPWRLLVVGAVLLVGGASVAGYRIFEGRRPPIPPAAAPAPSRPVGPPAPPRPAAPPAPAAAVRPGHPAVAPAAAETAVRPSRRPRRRSALAPSELEREAASLAMPMARIRRGGDLTAALAEIDDYLRRFPRGTLRPEARLLRVDALLLLGRAPAALAALDAIELDDNRRGLELRLLRGELRAQSDCRAALPDFQAVLHARPAADLAGRARRDLADCLRRLPPP
jgi:hypothetical protein